MAAFAPLFSEQYSSDLGGATKAEPRDYGPLKIAYAKLTCTTAGDSGTANMLRLPSGKIRVHPGLSYYKSDDMTALANLSVGHAAYRVTGASSDTAANTAFFVNQADSGGAAIAWTVFALPTGVAPVEFDTENGIDVTITIDTANIDLNDVVEVWIAYQDGN